MAHVGDDTGPVLARAEEAGDAAIVVLDDRERPVAWPWLRQVRGHDKVRGMPRENLVTLDEAATLNDPLDTMLTAPHTKAIVTRDRDRHLAVLHSQSIPH